MGGFQPFLRVWATMATAINTIKGFNEDYLTMLVEDTNKLMEKLAKGL